MKLSDKDGDLTIFGKCFMFGGIVGISAAIAIMIMCGLYPMGVSGNDNSGGSLSVTIWSYPNEGPLNETIYTYYQATGPAGTSYTILPWEYSRDGIIWNEVDFYNTITGENMFPEPDMYYLRMKIIGVGGMVTSNVVTYTAYTDPVSAS